MTSSPGEGTPRHSDKAAEDISALARQEPMLIIGENGETRESGTGQVIFPVSGTKQRHSDSSPRGGLRLLQLDKIFPEPGVSTTHVTEQSTNADLEVFEFVVKQDVTASDVVDAIKQQLHPDEQ